MSESEADRTMAEAAATRWAIDATTLKQVHSTAHLVYAAELDASPVYLRLTNPTFRSFVETQAECDYLAHLEDRGIDVASPQRSLRGRHVESIPLPGANDSSPAADPWSAVVFTAAPGLEVTYGAPAWSDAFVTEWGRALGRIHGASAGWRPVAGWERKHWDEDYWIRHALLLLPPDEAHTLLQYEVLMAYFRELPRTPDTYGMTHGNFTPPNLRYDPERGVTAFDFSNAGFHWTMWDLAIALSAGLHLTGAARHRFRTALIRGYGLEYPSGLQQMDQLDWFLRLRIFYLYLTSLWRFGAEPTAAQQDTLAELRNLIDHPISWRDGLVPHTST